MLFLMALVVYAILIILQPVPGYMDAAYYYATGIQLADGNGFNEPFLWNYLDDPQSLPHPSHSYWYPLASLIAALGMAVVGNSSFLAARIGFYLMAAVLPPVVALLSWRITRIRRVAIISGLLAIFCGYYLPFLLTTDNYAVYMLIGAVYFLLLDRISRGRSFVLGLLAGFINLARADGLLWLPLTLLAVTLLAYQQVKGKSTQKRLLYASTAGIPALAGYFIVMGFWFLRNWQVFGSLTPPGSSHVLWMTSYNQIFSYTPEVYTFSSWLATGWEEILLTRFASLWKNLGTAVMAQGALFLVPLILLGGWKNRHLPVVKLAFFGWVVLLLAESFLFPYASVRGGFFHAGAAFQPLWFVLAPFALESLLSSRLPSGKPLQLPWLFHLALVTILVVLSVMLVKIRVLDSGWNEGEYRYMQAEELLITHGITPQDIVMVINPPAYHAMTRRQAIVIPDGDLEALLDAANQFNARYLILESNHLSEFLDDLYQQPEGTPGFTDIGGFEDVRLVYIEQSEQP